MFSVLWDGSVLCLFSISISSTVSFHWLLFLGDCQVYLLYTILFSFEWKYFWCRYKRSNIERNHIIIFFHCPFFHFANGLNLRYIWYIIDNPNSIQCQILVNWYVLLYSVVRYMWSHLESTLLSKPCFPSSAFLMCLY